MSKNRFSGLSGIKTLQTATASKSKEKVAQNDNKPQETTLKLNNEIETRRRGRPNGKRSNENFRQVTAYIEKDTYKQTKMKLLANDEAQEFSELIDGLLKKWLEENK